MPHVHIILFCNLIGNIRIRCQKSTAFPADAPPILRREPGNKARDNDGVAGEGNKSFIFGEGTSYYASSFSHILGCKNHLSYVVMKTKMVSCKYTIISRNKTLNVFTHLNEKFY